MVCKHPVIGGQQLVAAGLAAIPTVHNHLVYPPHYQGLSNQAGYRTVLMSQEYQSHTLQLASGEDYPKPARMAWLSTLSIC